jgi:phage terminase large subunit-like protein
MRRPIVLVIAACALAALFVHGVLSQHSGEATGASAARVVVANDPPLHGVTATVGGLLLVELALLVRGVTLISRHLRQRRSARGARRAVPSPARAGVGDAPRHRRPMPAVPVACASHRHYEPRRPGLVR